MLANEKNIMLYFIKQKKLAENTASFFIIFKNQSDY
jgi:hypothetical protein